MVGLSFEDLETSWPTGRADDASGVGRRTRSGMAEGDRGAAALERRREEVVTEIPVLILISEALVESFQ